MTILIVATAIAALVGLVAIAKVNPFLAFLVVSIGMAIALGVPPADVPALAAVTLGTALACSPVNDAGFWLFKEYFNVGLADTLKTWTVMESIVSVVGLAGVLVLSRFVPA